MLLHRAFIESARRHRGKIALVDRTTDRRLTYGRALIGALVVRRWLRRIRSAHVGIMMPTSAGGALAVIGALMAGRIPVMVNYSTGASENIAMARRRTGLRTVVTARKLLQRLAIPEDGDMLCMEDILAGTGRVTRALAALQSWLPRPLLEWTIHRGDPDDTAVLLFTSGSEAEPKGVELTHRSIGSNLEAVEAYFEAARPDGVMLATLPLFHVFGFSTTLWLPLYLGETVVTWANPLEFRTVAAIIREERPTQVITTPYFLAGYLRAASPGDLESVELLVVGADRAPDWLHRRVAEDHGLTLVEGYGTTETSPVISANPEKAPRPGSVGRPLPGIRARVVGVEDGEPRGPGEEGRIQIRGPGVMKGYYNDVEATLLKFHDGWYETGDVGVMDEDGYLWLSGRLSRFVKIAGEMVSLPRVEAVAAAHLPEEAEVCAAGVEDPRKGAAIAMAVAPPEGAEVDTDRLQRAMAGELPAIARPRRVYRMEELPKMASGKLDFRRAEQRIRALAAGEGMT
ncbi:MAG: AMP-binding protein [Pseudomonadota bacterium]